MQNKLLELVIDPEVDEEVSNVVDVNQIEEVGRYLQAAVSSQNVRTVGDDGQKEKTDSNLYRLLVTRSLARVSALKKIIS